MRDRRCVTERHAAHVVAQRPASENTSDLLHCLAWLEKRPCCEVSNKTMRSALPHETDLVRGILVNLFNSSSRNGCQQGDRTAAQGVTPDTSAPLSTRTWNSSAFSKEPRKGLLIDQPEDSNTVPGIRLRELAGYLLLTALGVKVGRGHDPANTTVVVRTISQLFARPERCTLCCRKAKSADHTRCTPIPSTKTKDSSSPSGAPVSGIQTAKASRSRRQSYFPWI